MSYRIFPCATSAAAMALALSAAAPAFGATIGDVCYVVMTYDPVNVTVHGYYCLTNAPGTNTVGPGSLVFFARPGKRASAAQVSWCAQVTGVARSGKRTELFLERDPKMKSVVFAELYGWGGPEGHRDGNVTFGGMWAKYSQARVHRDEIIAMTSSPLCAAASR